MKFIIVHEALAREGIEYTAMDYWTGRWGTRVDRFVGKTHHDLERFLWWAVDAGVTVNRDEARSEDGRARIPSQRPTMLGFQACVPEIEYASIEAAQ